MDETLAELLQYAAKRGVQLAGITPRRLPGRGYGMVATRNVAAGETVLAVPTRALRTLASVPKAISRKLDHDVSVHGILAAHLVLDDTGEYAAWDAVLPTPADLEAGMPLLWPAKLQDLLPSPARTALARQQAKLQRDWEGVKDAEGSASEKGEKGQKSEEKNAKRISWKEYRHAWLLVNSRTFYYTTPRSEKLLPSFDDRIAMQPVADLFNHAADRGCRAAYGAEGFSFVADRPYSEGDEVPISYGAHANDALLVEYGFILSASGSGSRGPGASGNRWDEVCLDAVVLPRLTAQQKDDLDEAGFLGRYMVDAATPGGCYRTQVALRRILCGTSAARRAAWLELVQGLAGDSNNSTDQNSKVEATQEALDELLLECLDEMAEVAHKTLAKIERLAKAKVGTESQRGLLAQRWHQVEAMVVLSARRIREGEEEVEAEAADEEKEEKEGETRDKGKRAS